MRTLSITAAEWASIKDGDLWLVREARTHEALSAIYGPTQFDGLPPAEFLQACAPCVAVKHAMSGWNGAESCPDCLTELVGPCKSPTCEDSTSGCSAPICGDRGIAHLGWAYAVGQPLPIVDAVASEKDDGIWIHVKRHKGISFLLIPAHYGSPESLVGRWALRLAVGA